MKDLEEQSVCVIFCLKLGKSFMETFQMLQQAYGEDCLSRTQCYEWYQRFKSGRYHDARSSECRIRSLLSQAVRILTILNGQGEGRGTCEETKCLDKR